MKNQFRTKNNSALKAKKEITEDRKHKFDYPTPFHDYYSVNEHNGIQDI